MTAAVLSPDSIPTAEPIVVTEAYRYVDDHVARNETLSHVFGRHSIAGPELLSVLQAAQGLRPDRVRPGDQFEFKYLIGDSLPIEVSHRLRGADEFLVLERTPEGDWTGARRAIEWNVRAVRIVGAIRSSLWETIDALIHDSLLPPREQQRMVSEIADDVFGWQIDFTRDIREGDQFQILFERLRSSEGDVRYGRLLAAKIETAGTENSAYLLEVNGTHSYYDANGRSLRRAFRLLPVRYARLTSNFSYGRLHPILRVRRPHLGTDYAAATGTPVRATANGTVLFAGRDRGYGRLVTIRHIGDIETRYAHLRSIARDIRVGARISQDQVIGTVGMTGLATAPHVHYEFLKNGRHLNPRRVDLGDGTPVPEEYQREFDVTMARFDAALAPSQATLIGIR